LLHSQAKPLDLDRHVESLGSYMDQIYRRLGPPADHRHHKFWEPGIGQVRMNIERNGGRWAAGRVYVPRAGWHAASSSRDEAPNDSDDLFETRRRRIETNIDELDNKYRLARRALRTELASLVREHEKSSRPKPTSVMLAADAFHAEGKKNGI